MTHYPYPERPPAWVSNSPGTDCPVHAVAEAESIIQQIRYLLIHSHDLEQAKGEGVIPGDGRTRYRLNSRSFATVQDTLKIIRAQFNEQRGENLAAPAAGEKEKP